MSHTDTQGTICCLCATRKAFLPFKDVVTWHATVVRFTHTTPDFLAPVCDPQLNPDLHKPCQGVVTLYMTSCRAVALIVSYCHKWDYVIESIRPTASHTDSKETCKTCVGGLVVWWFDTLRIRCWLSWSTTDHSDDTLILRSSCSHVKGSLNKNAEPQIALDGQDTQRCISFQPPALCAKCQASVFVKCFTYTIQTITITNKW